jgi:hypothetical protein
LAIWGKQLFGKQQQRDRVGPQQVEALRFRVGLDDRVAAPLQGVADQHAPVGIRHGQDDRRLRCRSTGRLRETKLTSATV